MPRPVEIRQACLADAHRIAQVQVETWGTAYKGLVPDALIEQMRVADRAQMWEKIFTHLEESGRGAVAVALRGGEIVGFGAWGAQREEELEAEGFSGEITALYVLPDHQRGGIGRALMDWLGHGLMGGDHGGAALWVLSNNAPACRFYEAMGGEAIRTRSDPYGGDVSETAYGWRSIDALAGDA